MELKTSEMLITKGEAMVKDLCSNLARTVGYFLMLSDDRDKLNDVIFTTFSIFLFSYFLGVMSSCDRQ